MKQFILLYSAIVLILTSNLAHAVQGFVGASIINSHTVVVGLGFVAGLVTLIFEKSRK